MKHKAYPAYKPSGVEWLGDVPDYWEVKHFRRIIKAIKDGTHGTFDRINEGSPLLSAKNVFEDGIHISENESLITEEDFESIVNNGFPKKGDILLTIVGTIGRTFVFDKDDPDAFQRSVCFIRLIVSNNPYYLRYFIQSKYYQEQLLTFSKVSAQGGVYMGDVLRTIIITPPIAEQLSIATFLDRETGRIDTLVAKKCRLIELLREKRSALISHAVTKGLDPSVKLKPSIVEWLDDVPDHWEVLAVKRIVATPVTDGPHETPEILDEGIPFVSAEAIKNDQIDFTKIRGFISIQDHKKYSLKYKPQRNDIYIIKSGATTGNVAMVETDDDFNIWSPLAAIRPNLKISFPRFLFHFVKSREFMTSIQLGWSFGTQQNIGMNVIENLYVTLPPLPEQQAIAAFLDREMGKIDALIAKVEDAIVKLKEYRTALISAAVTGKIDVREAA